MELDDLKLAWKTLDRRLESQQALQLDLLRESRLQRVGGTLRRLRRDQIVQLATGVLATVVLGRYTLMRLDAGAVVVTACLALLTYTAIAVVLAIRDIDRIARVDFDEPVLAIQQRLLEVRAARIRSGAWFAAAGCVVWLPLVVLVMHLFGVRMNPGAGNIGLWLGLNALVCAGLLGGLLAWTRRHPEGRLAQLLRKTPIDRSLREVAALAEEMERFRRE